MKVDHDADAMDEPTDKGLLRAQFQKCYADGPRICCDLELALDHHNVLVLLGPSGCGKTTILRALAGLIRPTSGYIHAGSQAWFDADEKLSLSPAQRGIGFCFQDPALFPHLNVRENIWFGIPTRQRNEKQLSEQLAALEISDLLNRRISEISGGQAQRVSLARALIRRPRLMLLDEPFAALDASLRLRMRRWLLDALSRQGVPAIVVSHDREEAIALADRLTVIHDGEMLQTGTPGEVFMRPVNATAADIVGVETVLQARVTNVADDVVDVRIGGNVLRAASPAAFDSNASRPIYVGADVVVCIHGDSVALSTRQEPDSNADKANQRTSVQNQFGGTIKFVEPIGGLVRVGVEVDSAMTVIAAITRSSLTMMNLAVGENVTIAIKATAIHIAVA